MGWDVSLRQGRRTTWFEGNIGVWFGLMGMFNTYKAPTAQRLSIILSDFFVKVNADYPVDSRSNDSTGEADEDLPPRVSLVQEFECWKTGRPILNTQRVAAWIANGVAQQTIFCARAPLFCRPTPFIWQ